MTFFGVGMDILWSGTLGGIEKGAVPLFRTSRFYLWTSNFYIALACQARDQASRVLTRSLKGQTKSCAGREKFDSFLS